MLSTHLGLCIRHKILRCVPGIKVRVEIMPGTHQADAQSTCVRPYRFVALCVSNYTASVQMMCTNIRVAMINIHAEIHRNSLVTKQLNDKERVAAALDNPSLLETVKRLTEDPSESTLSI